MKLKLIPCIIALAASGLVAFGLYSWCRAEEMNILIAIVGGISMVLTFGTTIGMSFDYGRANINVKVVSGIATGMVLISNIVFCCLNAFSYAAYIITNGILLLAWLMIVYGIAKH